MRKKKNSPFFDVDNLALPEIHLHRNAAEEKEKAGKSETHHLHVKKNEVVAVPEVLVEDEEETGAEGN